MEPALVSPVLKALSDGNAGSPPVSVQEPNNAALAICVAPSYRATLHLNDRRPFWNRSNGMIDVKSNGLWSIIIVIVINHGINLGRHCCV